MTKRTHPSDPPAHRPSPSYPLVPWRAPEPRRRAAANRRAQGPSLGGYVEEHLARKRIALADSIRWLTCVAGHLRTAVATLGANTRMAAIRPSHVEELIAALRMRSNGRGGTLSPSTINHYLDSLNNLFRRAERDGLVNANPVGRLLVRPLARRSIAWLEVPKVSAILTAARGHHRSRPDLAIPFLFELVALFAYTGVRKAEGLGLQISDVRFDRDILIVRPNRWRGLKTRESERVIPLISELGIILRRYVRNRGESAGELLFPSPFGGGERSLQNLRNNLGRLPLPKRLTGTGTEGIPRLGARMLRHSYCAARLQTLDWGAPISPYTVARELGHSDLSMVLRIYGHLGKIRARHSEVSFLGHASGCSGPSAPIARQVV